MSFARNLLCGVIPKSRAFTSGTRDPAWSITIYL